MILSIDGFEFNNKEPIYLQIIELIKKNIALGVLTPGMKLPSVRELSKELGVNPNTLQRAYGELERIGITYTKRGMGSFISEGDSEVMNLKEDMGRQLVKKFIEEMKAIGIDKDEAIEIIKMEE
ncbi:HTH-type transcriptional repressor yvoA [uncultured Clostridium sp.]|uniref:GntR family transcriptional regulator n=1 Tax=uncultured Clostridium sp. TaxID=59620 RepID=UPI00082222BB|nr:GntR family transcriptional regulator [uncultured Clostridium sp.]SCJ93228.1 HTH-type transcriptional repressor yvoA [uncultured Clostridium sp.]